MMVKVSNLQNKTFKKTYTIQRRFFTNTGQNNSVKSGWFKQAKFDWTDWQDFREYNDFLLTERCLDFLNGIKDRQPFKMEYRIFRNHNENVKKEILETLDISG